ncbi:MAG: hypothetical protein LBG26_01785 [Treponema sp.]|jgi:hypothetical protein|nr:hypothetical protein [Treponema sp.]
MTNLRRFKFLTLLLLFLASLFLNGCKDLFHSPEEDNDNNSNNNGTNLFIGSWSTTADNSYGSFEIKFVVTDSYWTFTDDFAAIQLSGTYRTIMDAGNMMILANASYSDIGTASVSGNTLYLNLAGSSYALTKDDGSYNTANPFIGTWSGFFDDDYHSYYVTATITDSSWTINLNDGFSTQQPSGTYTRNGNTAVLYYTGYSQQAGTATVSGDTLYLYLNDFSDSTITLTKLPGS